jgi:hypothetical protein
MWNWTRAGLLIVFLICLICNLARLLVRIG